MVVRTLLDTASEGLLADARHAVGDGDRGQAGAFPEGHFADARHAGRDGDRGQTGAVFEGTFADALHAVADGDAGQSAAFIEGIIADARHARLDDNTCDGSTIVIPTRIIIIIVRHGACAADSEGFCASIVRPCDAIATTAITVRPRRHGRE